MWIVAVPNVSFSLCFVRSTAAERDFCFWNVPRYTATVMHKSKNHSWEAEDILFFSLSHHTTLILLIQDSVLTWPRNLLNSLMTHKNKNKSSLFGRHNNHQHCHHQNLNPNPTYFSEDASHFYHKCYIFHIIYIFLHKINFPRTGARALGQATANKIWWCPHLQEGVCSPNWHY